MHSALAWLGTSVIAVAAYSLGSSGTVPRNARRLRYRVRTTLTSWLAKPAWHPARWAVTAAAHAATSWIIVRAFTLRPAASVRLMRQVLALSPRRQPVELQRAVTEAADLHVPGQRVTHVYFAVHQHQRVALDNVSFRHGRLPGDVTRITLGGNPVTMGGPADPDVRAQLQASRDRVAAALSSLKIGPDITSFCVPVARSAAGD
ncbi:hypothetical protein [Streptomyces venezuelae]|uniref:hypothetical protein n=1 Tax=Streptomyces venezuelae TaxID=54571 RepID=UPI003443F45C